MKIETSRSMRVADKVLKALRTMDGPKVDAAVYVNGRESGWTLFPQASRYDAPSGVTFSENRNSDDIVVYTGTNPYVHQDLHITDESYRTRTFHREPEAAARTVATFLRNLNLRKETGA